MRSIKRNILLNPGPATTTDRVKYAQVVPDICPREEEFGRLMKDVSHQLTCVVGDHALYTTILFSGSGTAAVESILSSVIDQDLVVIINNGKYGKRMCEMAEAYQLNFLEYQSSPHTAIDMNSLEAFIQNVEKKISHLAVVHNETTTGLLNNIELLGKMCKQYNIEMIVDAMSSFAAIPIQMAEMNISYLAASSNKNLQGMAGISFVIADRTKLETIKNITPRNHYLNLYKQYQHFSESNQMRFTPPVQTIYALHQAIKELETEGISARYERYSQSWYCLIQGITRLGLTHLVDEKDHSKIVTSIIEPECEKYNFQEMHDFFYNQGFTIYPGKLENMPTFRVANIGDITYKDIEAFLQLLEDYLAGIDYIEKKGVELVKDKANKLGKYKFMKASEHLAPHLPKTYRFSRKALWILLKQYGAVIIKPNGGGGGLGVIKVTYLGNRRYEIHKEKKRITVKGKKRAYLKIRRIMQNRVYIVQRYIHLATIDNRPLDMRIIVQRKSHSSRWDVTGELVKVAGEGYIVTNNTRSKGTLLPIRKGIRKALFKGRSRRKILAEVHQIARWAAERLVHYYPRQRIFGLDMGLDRDGHIWIIEANKAPSMSHFLKIKNYAMYRRIMKYKES